MQIGELAKKAGCSVETIRYYEKEQLLPIALRNESNNYRHYDQQHLDTLIFIRRCRSLDMSHDEIHQLMTARQQPEASCESINVLIDNHIEQVQLRIDELFALKNALSELRNQCHSIRKTSDCGILQQLADRKINLQHTPK